MESSSIVSFNNDSAFPTTLKADYNNFSVHELALHAMRDRCLLLQRRINTLETENMRLKLDASKATRGSSYMPLEDDEKLELQRKIAELSKQKSQLMHHVFMVSCENRNLWAKISILKAPDKTNKDHTKQPLLRTNTYIQSTPKTSENYQEKYSENSLEEISLKLINSYIQEKSQLVEQYEQMAQLQDMDDDILNLESIGFAYMEDPVTDSLKEIHSHTEKLQNMKKELALQEQQLKAIISRVERMSQDGFKCSTCANSNAKVTSSEHKEIETSDSLANWATPVHSSSYNNFTDNTNTYKKSSPEDSKELTDKICPMCGKSFQRDTPFIEFQSHVENHFIGDMENDSLVDNFENNSFDAI